MLKQIALVSFGVSRLMLCAAFFLSSLLCSAFDTLGCWLHFFSSFIHSFVTADDLHSCAFRFDDQSFLSSVSALWNTLRCACAMKLMQPVRYRVHLNDGTDFVLCHLPFGHWIPFFDWRSFTRRFSHFICQCFRPQHWRKCAPKFNGIEWKINGKYKMNVRLLSA